MWVLPAHGKIETMKKFLCVLLVLIGLAVVVWALTGKKDGARRSWDETLAQVPEPDSSTGE